MSWLGVLTVSALSVGGIFFTQGPGYDLYAQAAKSGKKARVVLRVPGAGSKLDAAALARIIDEEVARRLKEEGIQPSPLADDAQFLRRVHLDLVGVIPTAEKVAAFLDSKDPQKRTRLVEELLADTRFGKWMGENWTNAMVPRESINRLLKKQPLHDWLADSFNSNKPWDKLVYELVTASGPQDSNGAITYFVANNTVDKVTDSVTKLFMGVQLQCAQCHNHPFTSWKQDEYWGMAQFFMKVRVSANPQQAAKKGLPLTVSEAPAKGKAKKKGLPESAKFVPARFLQGAAPRLNPTDPARPVLAKWMTSADNPFFARAFVNKLWAHFHGRGLVNPIDDMHEENPASHPELLAALTEQFKRNHFDVKYLIKAILISQPYQRTSRPHAGNEADTELFSHAAVRVLSPEQLYDSLTTVVGQAGRDKFGGRKGNAKKKGGVGPRDQFISFFHVEDADPLEYQAGIPQALRLMNSAMLNNTNAFVTQAAKQGGNDPARVVEHLYLAILSRRPTAEELQARVAYVRRQTDARAGYSDLAWALLNSGEFATNH